MDLAQFAVGAVGDPPDVGSAGLVGRGVEAAVAGIVKGDRGAGQPGRAAARAAGVVWAGPFTEAPAGRPLADAAVSETAPTAPSGRATAAAIATATVMSLDDVDMLPPSRSDVVSGIKVEAVASSLDSAHVLPGVQPGSVTSV